MNFTEKLSSGDDILYDFSWHKWGGNMEELVSALLLSFTCILLLCMVLSHYIGHRWNTAFIPEAAAILLVGIVFGGLLHVTTGLVSTYLLSFSPTIFFIFFLPPIIFNSAYHMKGDFFFAEFKAIVSFATMGTFISALFIAGIMMWIQSAELSDPDLELTFPELLTFGSLISATDPVSTLAVFTELRVDPTLYYIVLGESLVNDAVGLVLFNTFSKFVGYTHGPLSIVIGLLDFIVALGGSVIVGYACGCLAAYALRKVNLTESPVTEIGTYVILAYAPFLVSEVIGMSGIVTVLASGMTMRRYAHPNLTTPKVRETAQMVLQIAAQIAETAVFLNLGLTVFNFEDDSVYNVRFIFAAIMSILVARAGGVFGLSYLLNQHRQQPLSIQMQTMIWFAGLRGAVAFACATVFPDNNGHRHDIIAATMIIILVTVFIKGSLTKPMIDVLQIERSVDYDTYHNPPVRSKFALALMKFQNQWIHPILLSKKQKARRMITSRAGAFDLNQPTPEDHHIETINRYDNPGKSHSSTRNSTDFLREPSLSNANEGTKIAPNVEMSSQHLSGSPVRKATRSTAISDNEENNDVLKLGPENSEVQYT